MQTNPRVENLAEFCKRIYWQHPIFSPIRDRLGESAGLDKKLRYRLLPSNRLRAAAKQASIQVAQVIEKNVYDNDSFLGEMDKLSARNERGWNCYFFPNLAPSEFRGNVKDKDISVCPFLFLDFDIRLPFAVEEFQGEFGLAPWAIWSTSEREGLTKYQMLFAVAPEDVHDIERWVKVSRELVAATGADIKVKNPGRILRLPGTINWKDTTGGKCVVSEGRLLISTEEVYGLGQIESAIEDFRTSAACRELCARRAADRLVDAKHDRLHGGNRDGFVDFRDALENAESGIRSVKCGARHDHLVFWMAQMLASGVAYSECMKTIERLNAAALEEPVGGKEWEDLLSYSLELKAKQERDDYEQDRRIEKLLDEVEEEPFSLPGELGTGESAPRIAGPGQADRPNPRRAEGVDRGEDGADEHGCCSVGEGAPSTPCSESASECSLDVSDTDRGNEEGCGAFPIGDEDDLELPGPDDCSSIPAGGDGGSEDGHGGDEGGSGTVGDGCCGGSDEGGSGAGGPGGEVGEQGARVSVVQYAARLALQCDDQTSEEWFKWVVGVAKRIRYCKDKNDSSFGPLAEFIYRRLCAVGLNYGRWFAIPRCIQCPDGRQYWCLCPLAYEDSRVFFTHFFWSIQTIIRRNKDRILEALQAEGVSIGKAKLRWVCSRAFTSEATDAILAFGIDNVLPGGTTREAKIVFQNGVLDLRKGKFEPDLVTPDPSAPVASPSPSPSPRLRGVRTKGARFRSPAAITCKWISSDGNGALDTPQFDKFLEEAFPGDREGQEFIWRIIGYCLLPSNPLQKMFYFEGVTAGGKGILAEIIMALVGDEAGGVAQFGRLAVDAGLGPYVGKSFLFVDEAEAGVEKTYVEVMATLKRAAGGNKIPVRSLHEDERNVCMGTKFLLASNKALEFEDVGGGMARRIVAVHFSHSQERVVSEPMSLKIAREEGDRIATKAATRLLSVWKLGPALFSGDAGCGSGLENAVNLRLGREVIKSSTQEVYEFCSEVFTPTDINDSVPTGLILTLCRVAAARKKLRYQSEKAFAGILNLEMERLGFGRLSGGRFRGVSRGRGFSGCTINKLRLLEYLELTQDELEELIGRYATEISRKYAAEYLDLNEARMSIFSKFQSHHNLTNEVAGSGAADLGADDFDLSR